MKTKKPKKHRLNFRFNDATVNKLETLAHQLNVPMTEIVETAIGFLFFIFNPKKK